VQRKAYVPGLATLLVALVTGCTASSGTDDPATDFKAGEAQSSAAPPGKYRTLREPCGSIGQSTLRGLLPGVAELPEEQRQKVYRGTPAFTYDTDRRVGCNWKADAPDASHRLALDFERVVSYDTAVSDDDRAQEVYAKKQAEASVPIVAGPQGEDQVQESTPATPATLARTTPTTPITPTTPTGTASPPGTGTVTGLQPRVLDGLGDVAFLDDVLTAAGAGSTAQNRTVSVVFRTSNVIVTIVYAEQPALTTEAPDSKELQEKVQSLASRLAEQFSE
jgi:hypothetical protein